MQNFLNTICIKIPTISGTTFKRINKKTQIVFGTFETNQWTFNAKFSEYFWKTERYSFERLMRNEWLIFFDVLLIFTLKPLFQFCGRIPSICRSLARNLFD